MNTASEDLYMQQLQECINDDDKVITVPTAALLLKINIQKAKDLLSKYVKDNKKHLAITYIITGVLKDNTETAVCIVKEEDLDRKKEAFKNVSGETIYSVQKNKNIDFNVISLATRDELEKPRDQALLGFVVSKNCVKRVIKAKNLPTLPAPTIRGKSAVFMKNTKPEEKKVEKTSPETNKEKKSNEKAVVSNKKVESKAKQGGIANMFSKAPPKTNKSTEDPKVKVEKDEDKENGKKEETIKNGKEEIMDVDDDDDEEEVVVVKKEKKGKGKKTPTSKKNDNKRQRKKSSEGPNKRRKRIIERNDSDSDDLFEKEEGNNEQDESVIEPSDDEPEPVTIKKPLANKNKKRKAVEKTYEDEEGFIVTKTEYIWESGSENEEELKKPEEKPVQKSKPKVEKKNSSNSETEISPTKKSKKGKKEVTNQPSIMNFFKKK
ncbi:unnamed protein product [Brassicogethes aeneus]|uniref:DNA polymerase delta subunit 3 n=1 Tax=Brassicogethes aeneus TaxID=1431903 RepID=A0A9P0AS13_BRAAE|nr:unnamed protein product [Brassicogethes aeneus]